MRMRMLRVDDDTSAEPAPLIDATPDETQVHEIAPSDVEEAPPIMHIDELAYRYYGDPSLWKEIARINNVDDPLRLPSGALLRMPPRDELGSA